MSDATPNSARPPGAPASSQVILGWNLQPNSEAALRFAVPLAARLNAHLHVVHVADFNDLPGDPDAADWEQQLNQRLADDEITARALLDKHETRWTYHAERGRPSDVIADLADRTDALMIILGGPRGGLVSFIETLAGQSVSHQLTRPQGRPVLIVPEAAPWEDLHT